MFTNVGLVEHAKKALAEKWGYVYGTIGQILTESILKQKQQQYPDNINKYLDYIKANYMGKRTVDCVNLIKSYLWWDNQKNDVVYDIKYDKYEGTWMSADGAFSKATEKGDISTIPEIPGICVRYPGHIGVYIGNGEVIEARGTKYGVVKTLLKDRGWTHWLKYPGIEYVEGDDIVASAVSDIWKDKAVDFVMKFQTAIGITVDGKAGTQTNAKLDQLLAENNDLKTRLNEIRVKATL